MTSSGRLSEPLGQFLMDFGSQHGSNLGSKMEAKTVQNRQKIDAKMHAFDLVSILFDLGSTSGKYENKMGPKADFLVHVVKMSCLMQIPVF